MKHRLALLALLFCACVSSAQQPTINNNDLAKTPPMGWNSWNKFGCNVDENMIRGMADGIVSSGMKDAGYQYVVIDDCWQVSRDTQGNIVADPKRFPAGIKALADYVHSKGLKFGIYSDAGDKTCAGRPASRGHEFQDAQQYAAWGVDYLKYDWCNTSTQDAKSSYALIREALNATGRPIVLSICEWGTAKPWLWGAEVGGNLWRTTGDITDQFSGTPKEKWQHTLTDIIDQQVGLESFAGPGHWNDPDMLEVGNGGMSTNEYRAHFSMWAMLAAPLIAGNDVRTMTAEIKNILTDREVIAIDQDPLGRQARRVHKDGDVDIWERPLADGSRAVVFFNRGAAPKEATVQWQEIAYPAHLSAQVRDLWAKKDVGKFTGKFSATVAPHDVVLITVKP